MRSQHLIYTFFMLFALQASASVIVGPTVNPNNNHTYLLLGQSNWASAEAEAISLGGHLVTVNDADEQTWLLSVFSPNRDRHLWLGLNDETLEGHFNWSSGEFSAFLGFPPGEPNNYGGIEDYVYIDVAHSDAWNDLANISEQIAPGGHYIPLHGVVELNYAAVPEPSAVLLFVIGLLFMFNRGKCAQIKNQTALTQYCFNRTSLDHSSLPLS
jgi:hypothetical protein